MAKYEVKKLKSSAIVAHTPAREIRFPWSPNTVRMVCILLTLACYAPTIGYDFALEDTPVITQNQFTQKGISGIPEILSHDTFRGFFREDKNLVAGGRYRPLSLVFFALEKSVAGGPWFHHLINVLLYVLTVLLVFGFLRTALVRLFSPNHANWTASLAAILFAVHPIHTEVVAKIKGRDEILAFLLGLVALWIFWKPGSGMLRKGAALILFTLALFSKENAILWLPAGWLAYIFLDRQNWAEATKKISLFLVPVLFFLSIRYVVLRQNLDSPLPLEWLNEAFSMKPDDFETLRLLGVAYGVNRDNHRAVEFLEKALALQPDNAAVLFNLGTAYFNSGNALKGRELYENAKLFDSTLFIQ